MAGKNTSFGGTGVTIVLLATGALGMFIAFAVFFGKYSDARQQLEEFKTQNESIVRQGEVNQDNVRSLMSEARADGGKSLVGFLIGNRDALTLRISGDRRDTLSSIDEKLKGVEGADQPLVTMLRTRDTRLAGLKADAVQ